MSSPASFKGHPTASDHYSTADRALDQEKGCVLNSQ